MDTSDYPSMPNLNLLHARLAAQSRRVTGVVDSQVDGIEQDGFERLFSATSAQDWRAVAEASRYLASLRAEQVGTVIIREARHVCDELSQGPARAEQSKHLASLLAACREIQNR